MYFDEDAFKDTTTREEMLNDRDVAKLIYRMKNNAYEVLEGGSVAMMGGNYAIFVPEKAAELDVIEIARFNRGEGVNCNITYAWDTDLPHRISNSSRMSRPLLRLNLMFANSTEDFRTINFWFDAIRNFYTLVRMVKQRQVVFFPRKLTAGSAWINEMFFDVQFGDDMRHLEHVDALLKLIGPYITPSKANRYL